jgi:hypothetical protein
MVVIFPLPSSNVTAILHIHYRADTGRMAQLQTINLDWWRDPKGYRLVEGKPAGMPRIVRNGRPNDGPKHSRPLDETNDLFLIFARNATTTDGALKFVQRYGPLTASGNDQGDIVSYVTHHARMMRDLLKSFSTHRERPKVPVKFDVIPGVTFNAAVIWDPLTDSLRWQVRPSTLLDGLWLQFGQAVTRGAHIQTCVHCGKWFETGPGTGRRLDSKFCSDEHRIAFNSLKRSKEK